MIMPQLINIICNADLPITLRQDAQLLLNQLT
jgi:hypothetical protein